MEVYSKDIVQIRLWKIQREIFKEVGKKLAKIKVSVFRGETLKER